MKKIFSPKQKATVALEAVKGIKTTNQLSSHYEIHPTQVGLWKKALMENAERVFSDKRKNETKDKDELIERLYMTIGQRDIELEWLKKKLHIES